LELRVYGRQIPAHPRSKIVQYPHLVAMTQKFCHEMRTDKAGSTGYQATDHRVSLAKDETDNEELRIEN
jgi:hypothetical protein